MDDVIINLMLDRLKEMALSIDPDVTFAPKYGGTLFVPSGAASDKEHVAGIFAYKEHISLEFSQGYLLNDPDGRLSGNGKFRRHLKFKDPSEIDEPYVLDFLKQAFS